MTTQFLKSPGDQEGKAEAAMEVVKAAAHQGQVLDLEEG